MTLESLPNEVWLETFEYLNLGDIFQAFYDLNSRFHSLLNEYPFYDLNFQHISKRNMNIIFGQYLQSIVGRTRSLYFSNRDKVLNLPERLLSKGFTLDRFISLQSISLGRTHSFETLNQIISQCKNLDKLTHLNISTYCFTEKELSKMFNNIWSLPKLVGCVLNNYTTYVDRLPTISVISLSIKRLIIINNYQQYSYQLSNLFECTPNLQYFRISETYKPHREMIQNVLQSLISSNIDLSCSIELMTSLFQKLPNLCKLVIKTHFIYLNGYEWETILVKNLPKIEIFRLTMTFWISNSDNRDTKVNELLNSFRTPFWREKHLWFFRCHWYQSSPFDPVLLYSLPGIIDELNDSPYTRFESTCPDNNTSHDLYDRVRIFKYWSQQTNLCPDFMASYPKFRDIHHLKIKIPFNDNLWKFVSTLNQLNKLDVTMNEGSTYSQLQTLIDQAPHLYSLSIAYSYDLPITPSTFTITNASIRRVEFLPPISSDTKYMNKGKCMAFAHSPLGRQCEVLILHLETHTLVIDLIKEMPKLRSLTFMWQGDRWKGISQFQTKNNIIQWLRENKLPSSVSIIDSNQSYFIQLEINREI